MFTAQMKCSQCEYVSESFINCYYPPSDRMDFVFQNQITNAFRVVICRNVSAGKMLSESELDAINAQLNEKHILDDEIRIDVWFGAKNNYNCPKCSGPYVSIDLLSMF